MHLLISWLINDDVVYMIFRNYANTFIVQYCKTLNQHSKLELFLVTSEDI